MILKLYNQIAREEDKEMIQWFCGTESVCFKDVVNAIDAMEETDDTIDIRLHCNGGVTDEGFAIYDKIRQSGKKVSATVEGNCASMATIILLAAPKERRFATPSAQICIHNPYTCIEPNYEGLNAKELDDYIAKLEATKAQLEDVQNKIVGIYVERTGTDAETLQALMDEDKFVGVDKAVELGFIGSVLEPNTAQKKQTIQFNHKQSNKMNKKPINAGVFNKILEKLGISAKVYDLTITAPNGDELSVEREEGDPEVGDPATVNGQPDGEVTTEEGTKIVVSGGVITSITEETQEDPEDVKNLKAELDSANAIIAEKEAKINDLQAANEALEATKKTEEESSILNIVAEAGGKEWLDAIIAMKSNGTLPTPGIQNQHNDPPKEETYDDIRARRISAFEEQKQKFNKKK